MDMQAEATATQVRKPGTNGTHYPTSDEIWAIMKDFVDPKETGDTPFMYKANGNAPGREFGASRQTSPPMVTPDEVTMATFERPVDKKLFTGALAGLTSEDPPTRALAANAMGYIHHELSGKALIAQLARESSAETRAACITAMRRLEVKEGLQPITDALNDEHAFVRMAAVQAIYRLAGQAGADHLVRMLRDINDDVRRRAATCLGWLEHKPATVNLLPLLADGVAFVRRAAIDALATLGSPNAVPEIIKLLNDQVGSVRKKAYQALQTISRACEHSPEIKELVEEGSFNFINCFS